MYAMSAMPAANSKNTASISAHGNRSAFTLIELLVVIAIIAILAAILFPVFAQAREKARQTSCMSNLRNLSTAMLMYSNDFDELLPPSSYLIGGPPTGMLQNWCYSYSYATQTYNSTGGLIQPYLKNAQVQDCPTAADIAPFASDTSGNTVPAAYGYNTQIQPTPMARVQYPAETILLADALTLRTSGTIARVVAIALPSITTSAPTPNGRHNGVANVAWEDGHVKAMTPTFRTAGGSGASTYIQWKQKSLGDFTKSGVLTGDPVTDDYLYLADKNTTNIISN